MPSNVPLPSAKDVLQQYFGETDFCEYSGIFHKRMSDNSSRWEVCDQTCETTLFPYQAQDPIDPPLPTLEEIVSAYRNLKLDKSKFHKIVQVWRVGQYLVKAGTGIGILQEAENLLWLERNSNVRTPKLYSVFSSRDVDLFNFRDEYTEFDGEYHFMIREYIDGVAMDDLVEELEREPVLRKKIGKAVAEQFKQLRSIPPQHADRFGRVKGREFVDLVMLQYPPGPDFNNHGPFNYEELVHHLIHTGTIDRARSESDEFWPLTRILLENAKSALVEHTKPSDRLPVLSHSYLTCHHIVVNILRDEDGKAVDVQDVAIVDWYSLCWMPP